MYFRKKTDGHTVEQQLHFLTSCVRWLTYTLVATLITVSCVVWYLNQRRTLTDQRQRNMACIALRYTPPTSDFNRDLRKQYPGCPHYKPPPVRP